MQQGGPTSNQIIYSTAGTCGVNEFPIMSCPYCRPIHGDNTIGHSPNNIYTIRRSKCNVACTGRVS